MWSPGAINRSNDENHREQVSDQDGDGLKDDKTSVGNPHHCIPPLQSSHCIVIGYLRHWLPNPVILRQGHCCPRCHLARTGDSVGCHSLGGSRGGATGVSWVQARDAANHPAKGRRPRTIKNGLLQNIPVRRPSGLDQRSAHGGDPCTWGNELRCRTGNLLA